VALARIELALVLREASDEAAALLPVAASELRLAMLLESSELAELKLEAMDDWADPRDPNADVADASALEVTEANELADAEAAEAAELWLLAAELALEVS